MKRVIIFFIIMCISLCCVTDEIVKNRVKRKVLFTKNSKIFFRLNGKENVIPWNQLFSHGWAFRVNWDLPETLHKRHQFFKRDVHDEFEQLNMVPGYSCILKYFCEFINAIKLSNSCGIFCQIGNIITRSEGIDVDFVQKVFNKCDYYMEDCPYSLQETSYLPT